jgi:hypothetical protein
MTRQGSGKEKEKEEEEGLLCLNFVAGLENGKHTKARTFENALTLYGGSQLLLWSSVISSRPCCPQQNDVIGCLCLCCLEFLDALGCSLCCSNINNRK